MMFVLDSDLGKVTVTLLTEKGKEWKSSEENIVRASASSLQRVLALKLARERKPEKVSLRDIVILRCWWFRDGTKNKKGWYELVSKLKRVYPIQSQKFKDERLERQHFIFKRMQNLEGSFKERLEQTTIEVNKRFPKNKPYV
ncbi:MAG: hypothetical protein ACM3SR_15240, partial [Ignavibacteriales bacterium]